MTTTETTWGRDPKDVPTVEQRRDLLQLMAVDRSWLDLCERDLGESGLPFSLQALSLETVDSGIKLMELEDRMATLECTTKLVGALMAGLIFGKRHGASDTLDADDDDDDGFARAVGDAVFRQAQAIRRGAGVSPVGDDGEEMERARSLKATMAERFKDNEGGVDEFLAGLTDDELELLIVEQKARRDELGAEFVKLSLKVLEDRVAKLESAAEGSPGSPR